MRTLLIAALCAALTGCGADEKPMPTNVPTVQPQNSGAQQPAEVKKGGGRLPPKQ